MVSTHKRSSRLKVEVLNIEALILKVEADLAKRTKRKRQKEFKLMKREVARILKKPNGTLMGAYPRRQSKRAPSNRLAKH